MNNLGIEDITIGFSSVGAKKYVDELNTKAIVETNELISQSVDAISDSLQSGWTGKACEAYLTNLRNSADTLKTKLKEMEEMFNAFLAAQEQTYDEEDSSMADDIASRNIF